MDKKVIEINVGRAKRDERNRVMRVVNLSPESIEILERWSQFYGSEGKVIDKALERLDSWGKPAREYQARLNKLREEEKREDAERKARGE